MTPVLVTLAIIGGIGSVYRSKPWEDGWDKVRALFGNPRIHDIQGNWDVDKLLQVSPSASGPLLSAHVNEATLVFADNVVTFRLEIQGAEVDLKGSYEIDGTTVHVKGLKASDGNPPPIPSNLDLKLGWNGEDEVEASTSGDEEAFLHRAPTQQFVAMRSDRITTTYASNVDDGRGMISKPAGGQ
jgi:hypothetical protein